MNTNDNKILRYSFYGALFMFAVMAVFIITDSKAFNMPKSFYTIMGQEAVENLKISINNGDIQQLASLSGVGEVLAGRIIEYRTQNGGFTSLEELKQVKGIGEKLFTEIENYICL
ncbi:MAG: helix-hairpin-helix domain-containing protein [Oscillospiraceae bacterium]